MPIDPPTPPPRRDHTVRLTELPASADVLQTYARIPIAFEVRSRLIPTAPDIAALHTTPVDPPYTKDYDALPNQAPTAWPTRHDVTRWLVFIALDGSTPLGGAVLIPAHPTDPTAVATLWDLRIHPAARRRGIGTILFDAAASRARAQGHPALTVETQDINVPACRFYAARGCALAAIVPRAYDDFPDETQLVWRLPLA